jgi:hypothetical protein
MRCFTEGLIKDCRAVQDTAKNLPRHKALTNLRYLLTFALLTYHPGLQRGPPGRLEMQAKQGRGPCSWRLYQRELQ